jgi:cytochrome c551/c552
VPRRRRRNPWTSTGEVLVWILFTLLLFPAGFAGWAVGHYTSLGKPPATVTVTAAASTPSTPTTTASAATTSTSSGGANAAAGKAVFAANSCATCHTFQPAGATGQVGPDLDTAPTASAKLDHNMNLTAFVKQSIVDPNAYIAKGYKANVMPQTFGTSLSKTQLADLVAFIVSGQK